jgi:hypothetical protein
VKVFGTGYQRTGTSSLARALTQLGIPTRDSPRELWVGDYTVLQRYDGFTDNPVPIMYKELDARCPGAKFVHTIRDEASWLRSVEWLFTVGAVKFHWNAAPHFHEYHEALYGTTAFDAEQFLASYRRHNAEVLEYFAARPNDLLVMDITAGDGFAALAPFLGLPVPAAPFPRQNAAEPRWRVRLRQLVAQVRRVAAPRRDGVR